MNPYAENILWFSLQAKPGTESHRSLHATDMAFPDISKAIPVAFSIPGYVIGNLTVVYDGWYSDDIILFLGKLILDFLPGLLKI